MVSWAKSNGKLHMQLVHPVSQPERACEICYDLEAQLECETQTVFGVQNGREEGTDNMQTEPEKKGG